jgi:hypothetical protein
MIDFFSKYVSKTTLLIIVCLILGGTGYYHFNRVVLTCDAFAKEKTDILKTVQSTNDKTRLDTLLLHRSILNRDIDRYEMEIYKTNDVNVKQMYQPKLHRVLKDLDYVNSEIRKIK